MFYIPWNTDTFIHTVQLTETPHRQTLGDFTPKNVFTYRVPSDSAKSIDAILYTDNAVSLRKTGLPSSTGNNALVSEPLYSLFTKVYQLSPDIKYNIQNGDLIINATDIVLVYDRSGKSTTYKSAPAKLKTKIDVVPYSPWIINNPANTIQVLYVQSEKNTLVALFRMDNTGRVVLQNYGRFNETDVDNGNDQGTSDDHSEFDPDLTKSAISDYYKWYWYWNSSGAGANSQYSNNYMLKTQIVPPVCPSCPSVSCGKSDTSSDSKSGSGSGSGSSDNALNKTVDTTGNVINKTVDTTGNVINKTIDTTSNLLTSGGTGASNLLTSGATGATNLLTSGATGATNLLRDAGSGVSNILGKTLDTTSNILGGNSQGAGYYYGGLNTNTDGSYQAPGFSQGNPPTDSYSYYGALQNKGSQYIPITADFSAFKK
jgi:hypothetical protein